VANSATISNLRADSIAMGALLIHEDLPDPQPPWPGRGASRGTDPDAISGEQIKQPTPSGVRPLSKNVAGRGESATSTAFKSINPKKQPEPHHPTRVLDIAGR
jgi:hypothetical protein